MLKRIKRKPLPIKVVILANGKRSQFNFISDNTPAEAWSWVMDMASGPDSWQPMRIGKDLHMVPADVQWGTA
jgi:hypothetical protein